MLGWFYIVSVLFVVVLISFPVWSGEFSLNQWFFIGHSLHSIFTVGTVLVLDFLLLMAGTSTHLKQHIFPWFGTMSKVIWVGLGIDFLSVALIFGQALTLTPKFFFMQTVLGILTINGVLLSGPITRRLLSSIGKGAQALTKRWARIADISGIVSISSWLTITFFDSFTYLTLNYLPFVCFYLLISWLAFFGRNICDVV